MRKLLIITTALALFSGISAANARVDLDVGIGVPGVYAAPPPVVYAPPPPPAPYYYYGYDGYYRHPYHHHYYDWGYWHGHPGYHR